MHTVSLFVLLLFYYCFALTVSLLFSAVAMSHVRLALDHHIKTVSIVRYSRTCRTACVSTVLKGTFEIVTPANVKPAIHRVRSVVAHWLVIVLLVNRDSISTTTTVCPAARMPTRTMNSPNVASVYHPRDRVHRSTNLEASNRSVIDTCNRHAQWDYSSTGHSPTFSPTSSSAPSLSSLRYLH